MERIDFNLELPDPFLVIWGSCPRKRRDTYIFKADRELKNNADIEWNFTKFLLDQNGRVVSRVATDTAMITMTDAIATLL